MYIQELKEEGEEADESCKSVAVLDAKKVLVGAGARALFYPTLLYNLLRNKIQPEFRWWDRVDEFVLLGAVPFPTDVPRLKELGVSGVVTLNESYETLVPSSLYHAHDIVHLVIPTRDYLFAPAFTDICQAVDFIHENALLGKTTYVHCKAGRGRSTTIVLCYLVQHRSMTPESAYEYVRSVRPRVLLASSQWQAVQDYYLLKVRETCSCKIMIEKKTLDSLAREDTEQNESDSDDGTFVMVTESDLDGYDDIECESSGIMDNNNTMLGEFSLGCRVQFARHAAISRLPALWLGCHDDNAIQKPSTKKLINSVEDDGLRRSVTVDIQVH